MLPDELMKEVRRLQYKTRRRVEGHLAGEYHSAFKGRGIEFAEVREYEPGDDVRVIDWNVTARTGRPFIKRFIEERELTVVLAVDLSRSGAFGTTSKDKARVSVELAAVLAFSAALNNDRVGLLLFTEKPELFVPPRRGRLHTLRVLRELLGFEARGRGTDLSAALDHLANVLRRRSVVFIVSDFLDEGYQASLRALGQRHEVVAVTVSDPRERTLPKAGLIEVTDSESGERVLVDTSSRRVREQYAMEAARREESLRRTLTGAGVDRLSVSTDRPFAEALAGYFRKREARR